jgi:anhydro-N-acetylmuramic acid kinase
MTGEAMNAIGLMSGTSMDGIDAALIETDGERILGFGPVSSRPYSAAEQSLLHRATERAAGLTSRDERPAPLDQAEELVTLAHAAATRELLDANHISQDKISVIGFHGQTVLHKPESGFTVQLGNGRRLAALLGMDVVSDFRAADVKAGGQGAPLVPIFHKALADASRLPRPLCVLNIGGVANVTWIGRDGELVAFDTGPGNALIDDWVRRHTGEPYDRDGQLARHGVVDRKALESLLAHPYFRKRPPNSLDRYSFAVRGEPKTYRLNAGAAFTTQFDPPEAVKALSAADGAATLTAFTAGAAVLAKKRFPEQPALWIASGGGARNLALLGVLRKKWDGRRNIWKLRPSPIWPCAPSRDCR